MNEKGNPSLFFCFQTCIPECAPSLQVGTCPRDWPSHGEITFRDYQMRYRENTRWAKLVLDGLNLNIQSGQTVGIVGSTGSGEDKLWLCFFQAVLLAFSMSVLVKPHQRAGCVCVCVYVGLPVFFPRSRHCKLGFQVEWLCGAGSKHTSVFELINENHSGEMRPRG